MEEGDRYKTIKAELRNCLFLNTRRGKWDAVVKTYEEYPQVQELKLNRNGDTALHLAVLDNREEVVEKLVKLIRRADNKYNWKDLLETTNQTGSNPLHLAAEMGSMRMCHAIASAHDGLVDKRNILDQTPLFLAALCGNRDAFYCLYSKCGGDVTRIRGNCRVKGNGDTVLHCALRNEHFDLAFQLIHLNDEAKHWVSMEGITPLHVLASKPASFKSGSSIKGWRNIAYYCIRVDQLKPQPVKSLCQAHIDRTSKANTATCGFPANYATCIAFFSRLWDGFLKVSTLKSLFDERKNNERKNVTHSVESENFDTDESHQPPDTELLKAHRSANEASSTNFPQNCVTCIDFFQIVFSAIMIILGFGSAEINKIRKKKEMHTWSVQVMKKLLDYAPSDKYGDDGTTPVNPNLQTEGEDKVTRPYDFVDDEVRFSGCIESKPKEAEKPKDVQVPETVMLIAAKHGVIEIVKGLFERFPLAINDTRKDKKNVVLLAAEYRQPDVYCFLLENKVHNERLFRAVDNKGNSALHLAAAASKSLTWRITGVTLQMQWEIKWYKFIEESMPLFFFIRYNNEGKKAITIFHETHVDMMKKSGEWLTTTSKSGSVVGTLIVTLAFTTAASIPGGFNPSSGAPYHETQKAFFIFAVFSLLALSLSSTSVTMFLSILSYRFDAYDFRANLPFKLLVGLFSLFLSIISMLVSFCAGHYFLIPHHIQNNAALLYTFILFPVALIFLISKLPLYTDVLQSIFISVPSRRSNVVLPDPLTTQIPSKFKVTSITVEKSNDFPPSNPLLIVAPTTKGSYPVILFLPGCVEYDYSAFLQLIASHGFVTVAPLQFTATPTTSGMKAKPWVASDREMVEEKLSRLRTVEGGEAKVSLALGYGRASNPFSAVIGFDPVAGTKLSIPESQIRTDVDPQSESQFVVSKLCGTVKELPSEESS